MGTRAVERGPVADTVSESVRVRREELGLSQQRLAELLAEHGRPMQTTAVSKIESGDRRVDVDDLSALAEALEVTPAQLLSGDVTETRSRELLKHEAALGPVHVAAQKARDKTGLPLSAVLDYLRLADASTRMQASLRKGSTRGKR